MRAREGRVNGSLGTGRGRVNGSKAKDDRGKTNGAGLRTGASLRKVKRRSPKAKAAVAVLALLLPVVLFLAAPGSGARFAADGDFREWEGVPGVADSDAGAPA